jgi:rhomboid protease GluP
MDREDTRHGTMTTNIHLLTSALVTANTAITFYAWASHNGYVSQLVYLGATWDQVAVHGEWWRLLTALFVQLTWKHLVGNMLELWIFGNRVAAIFGLRLYLLAYLFGGCLSELSVIWYRRDGIAFGASLGTLCLAGVLVGSYSLRMKAMSLKARWKLVALLAYCVLSTFTDIVHPTTGNIGHPLSLALGIALGVSLNNTLPTASG